MKKIICGVIALLVGIVAFAESIDNKPTQDEATTILRHKKRSFIHIINKEGDSVKEQEIPDEKLSSIEFILNDSHKDMELIDKGDYIEIRKKGSPKPNSK